MTQEGISYEPPRKVDFHNVMYWEIKSKQLMELKKNGEKSPATMLSKAKKFLEHNCVEKVGNNEWIVKPIKGYNKTTYKIILSPNTNTWSCNCQGFKNLDFCSHILAIKQHEFIETYNERE